MYSFGVIMDPIENINPTEDSTFAIINALQQKCNIEYIVPDTIHIINQEVFAKIRRLHTYKRKNKFFTLSKSKLINLSRLNCILFRKDPPVDEKYIHITHMLDFLELSGVLIINSPQSIRDFNEKLLGNNLTNHNIPTLVSSDRNIIKGFIKKNKDVVMKPLNLMGGKDIVRLSFKDTELFKKIDNMTMFSKRIIMVQKFLNQVKKGDTRILITNGIVHEKVLVRYPPKNDFRANLSHGGIFKIKQINNEKKIYISSHNWWCGNVPLPCLPGFWENMNIKINEKYGYQIISVNQKEYLDFQIKKMNIYNLSKDRYNLDYNEEIRLKK